MNIALETSLISAGTSFVVLLLGQILWPILKERRARKREAKYLAVRVVCVLDRFVEDCASTAIDSGEEDEKGYCVPQVQAPDPPTYPNDINWKSIGDSMMYKVLWLPAATERAANYVQGSTDNASPPDYGEYFEARTESYANLGLQAHELSRMLRKQYNLPPVEFLAWDPISRMEDELRRISNRQEMRLKSYEEFSKSAPPPPSPVPG